ncbi:protein KRI1 homolog [Fopius arisanus]|uniref:Protein KRI1 homolog n=2 Tax=Fopius arisanus TaxID=64838 RepID=A0A9R1U212_9HYME|nr:PREDICTED: protein KRI1 homolog [Fopius arisanus]
MSKLFERNDSDSDEDIKINSGYANDYNNWRQKEELNKLKTKYGKHVENLQSSEGESESSSDDDGEGKGITSVFEKDFYKTLACLKAKDPRIYDESVNFFSDPKDLQENPEIHSSTITEKIKKKKQLTLRDYDRKMIIEGVHQLSGTDDENDFHLKSRVNSSTYVKEQKELKESIKEILQDGSDSNDDKDDLLQPKHQSLEEKEKEDESYEEWLKGQKTEIDVSEKAALKPLKDFWADPKLDQNEKFLRDYVLNKQFLGRDIKHPEHHEDRIHSPNENLSEDEQDIEQQEMFEHKFNFRFEEPDRDFLKRYPRTLGDSLRKKDTKRSEKRAEVKKRKEEEKEKRLEELKRLKVLKRKEIEQKIAQLKEVTGNDDIHFDSIDFEEDFDPVKHDEKMEKLFSDEYYKEEDGDIKPEFPDIDEELEIERTWDDYEPNLKEEKLKEEQTGFHCEDVDFNMDADYDPTSTVQEELTKSSRKKRKRRSKFSEMMSKDKPKFDPTHHTSYKDYFDQYYSLDYEDMIGDLPCRFKYRSVVPNDYGLSVEEILMADDKELNKWCSLKKALEHKPKHQELNEVRIYKQKSSNETYKKKILKSLYEKRDDGNGGNLIVKTNHKSKKEGQRYPTKADEVSLAVPIGGEDIIENKAKSVKFEMNNKTSADKVESPLQAVLSEEEHPRKAKLTRDVANIPQENEIDKRTENMKKERKKRKGIKGIVSQDQNSTAQTNDRKLKQTIRKEKYKRVQKMKSKYAKGSNDCVITSLSEERLRAYGIKAKNF